MQLTFSSIRAAIIDYVVQNHPSDFSHETLPRDQSLLEIGVLDSYGVVELVAFVETEWEIMIPDEDITKEKMGSIDRMATLVEGSLETN